MHSPTDNTVGIVNASKIFRAARHPRSFVSLEGADHLLTEGTRPSAPPASSAPGPNPYLAGGVIERTCRCDDNVRDRGALAALAPAE